MKRFFPVLAAGLLAACAPETTPEDRTGNRTAQDSAPAAGVDSSSGGREPEPPPAAATADAGNGRVSQFSSLADCRVLESRPDEAGYKNSACDGLGGYSLRLIDGDDRQNLFVRTPDGKEHSLRLSESAGGGFSRIGERIEWRGATTSGRFQPDAMVLRYFVVEGEGARETAYLLPVALGGKGPCVTGKIAPGPDQNERARTVTDGRAQCMARS